jgi:hypothetical protein
MSWNDYVNFIRANNATSAAYIFGADGALWASHNPADAGVSFNIIVCMNPKKAKRPKAA